MFIELPEPPPECQTEAEKTAFAFGWFKAMEAQRKQEPVAYWDDEKTFVLPKQKEWDRRTGGISTFGCDTPLYTTPPQPALASEHPPHRHCECAECVEYFKPEQEPVAYVKTVIEALYENSDPVSVEAAELLERITTPPQRTWVGLTDDEQQEAYEQWQNDGWGVFYNAIEAKLKEKNGYAEEKNT